MTKISLGYVKVGNVSEGTIQGAGNHVLFSFVIGGYVQYGDFCYFM